jgi:membrane protease YdiL (CAAX protease family)
MSCAGSYARAFFFQALLFAGSLNAAVNESPTSDVSPGKKAMTAYGTEGQYKLLVKRVTRAQSTQYGAIVAEYHEYIATHREDVVARIEKCRFINQFSDLEDFPIESAADDAHQCEEALRDSSFDNDGRVQLYLLDQMYGDDLVTQAEKLLPESFEWPQPLRARLYEKLADGHRTKNPDLAATDLANAVQLDPLSSKRVQVAQHLVKLGATQKALQLIRATPTAAWAHLSTYQAASLLIQLGAPEEAAQLLQAHPASGDSQNSTFLLAHALATAGHISAARDVYSKALGPHDLKLGQRRSTEYFQFELDHGTRKQAEDAYARLRDSGANSDSWGRFRLALFLRHPGAAWTLRDVRGVGTLLALLLILTLMPALVVGPVHYRSLAKRLRGLMPEPGRWGLRSLWYVLAVVLIVPTLAVYVSAYDTFATLISRLTDSIGASGNDVAAVGKMLVWQTIGMAVCAVPLLRRVNREFFLGKVSMRATLGWTLLALIAVWGAAVGLGYALQAYRHLAALGDLTTQALQSIQREYGSWTALALVAIFVPAIEEILFRGVILQSLSRFISFRWAAVIQASLFAGVHEPTQALPYVFLLGLLAALLVRRTGGLLAPMLFHGINNAVFLGVISTATAALNAGG